MSAERSWGADTVAFGRAPETVTPDPPPQRRPPRGPQRRRWPPANHAVALAGVGIVALVALHAVLGDGSGSSATPIRQAADSAPRVVVKSPTLPRRREQRHDRKFDLERQPKGQFEEGGRGPQETSPTPYTQGAAEPESAPIAEKKPEPAPVAEAKPEPHRAPTPPTPPTAEFGL